RTWRGRLQARGRDGRDRQPDRTARVWDTATGRPVSPAIAHAHPVGAVAFSRDGAKLVTGSGPTAQLWKAGTWQRLGPPSTIPGTSAWWRSARTAGLSGPPSPRAFISGTPPPACPAAFPCGIKGRAGEPSSARTAA